MTYPTIRQINGLLTVARLGSFNRAAVELGVSQSALSQSIQQMEFLLDAKLLERGHRQVTMTPAGEKLVIRLERLMRDLNEAITELKHEVNEEAGSVSIACLSTVATLLMPETVKRFKRDYPQVSITIRDDNVDGILEQVKTGEVDFAITCLFQDDREINFRPLLRDRFRFICHKDHPYSDRSEVSWDELREISMVTTTKGSGISRLIERALPNTRVFREAAYEVSRVPSVLKIVEDGGVSSVLPALSLAAVSRRSSISHCAMVNPVVQREVGVLSLRRQAISVLAARFLDYLIETMKTDRRIADQADIELLNNNADVGSRTAKAIGRV